MAKRRSINHLRKTLVGAAAIGSCNLIFSAAPTLAFEILGTGTAALIGNDLTDIGDDGDPDADFNYDAIFDSSDEQGFGGGEFAFNVFDNRVGGGNDKWCCGRAGGAFEDDPVWVSAQLPIPHFLSTFTIASANDTPGRDPLFWSLQGSNNGSDYTDIYTYEEDFPIWDERLQVIAFSEGEDFPVQTASYEYFRFATFSTELNPDGAYFQVAEIELFGRPDGVVPPIFVGGQGSIGSSSFAGTISNKMFGEPIPGLSGFSVTLVDSETVIDSHTIAEQVLDDEDGVVSTASYDVVDLGGGGGNFPNTQPYPNDVSDTNMEDFAVRAIADVVIPVGVWTIGFGSDDGGQLTIPGVEFDSVLSLNNDSFEDDQIRFEGNRGHGWTVGAFEVTGQPLETQIIASMHERGGGDSFEIAVIADEFIEGADPANGWELLGNGTLGWEVTHTGIPLVSADLSAEASNTRPFQFDVNGDTDTADQFVVDNPDPSIYTSILNIDGVAIQINATGAVANGDSFRIIAADTILGTPIISSVDPAQNWVFDAASGLVCLGSCPGVISGDYNGNGILDADDIDLLSAAVRSNSTDLKFDANGDGSINDSDRTTWVEGIASTYFGDSNFDGEFSSSDFVSVFIPGKYEAGTAATWGEGDWNGDGEFTSSDFVAAFIGGGYEIGPRGGVQAVPEPSTFVMTLLGFLGLAGLVRRK